MDDMTMGGNNSKPKSIDKPSASAICMSPQPCYCQSRITITADTQSSEICWPGQNFFLAKKYRKPEILMFSTRDDDEERSKIQRGDTAL
jgi:hypothetical protein